MRNGAYSLPEENGMDRFGGMEEDGTIRETQRGRMSFFPSGPFGLSGFISLYFFFLA